MQVRLITSADDPYIWKVLPGKEHLFKKDLWKYSIGVYMENTKKLVSHLKLSIQAKQMFTLKSNC